MSEAELPLIFEPTSESVSCCRRDYVERQRCRAAAEADESAPRRCRRRQRRAADFRHYAAMLPCRGRDDALLCRAAADADERRRCRRSASYAAQPRRQSACAAAEAAMRHDEADDAASPSMMPEAPPDITPSRRRATPFAEPSHAEPLRAHATSRETPYLFVSPPFHAAMMSRRAEPRRLRRHESVYWFVHYERLFVYFIYHLLSPISLYAETPPPPPSAITPPRESDDAAAAELMRRRRRRCRAPPFTPTPSLYHATMKDADDAMPPSEPRDAMRCRRDAAPRCHAATAPPSRHYAEFDAAFAPCHADYDAPPPAR